MNIAILGANGRTGQHVVAEALARGHTVRAGVYGPSSLQPALKLDIVQCDATSKQDVTALLEGCDAVVSVLGHVKSSSPSVQTTAIGVVLQCMQEVGISRLISLTGTGVRWQGDKVSFVDKVVTRLVLWFDPARIRDGIAHAAVIEASSLDWTIVRVLKLGNGPKQTVKPSEYGPARLLVSRATVASTILDILEKNTYIRKLPVL